MKNLFRNLALSLVLASMVYGAGAPPLEVTVSDASGKIAYKGRTSSTGTFSTGKLGPGNYIVQFNSKSAPAGQYTLVVSAGKKKVSADAVEGAKFSKGGVAMKLEGVPAGMNITGQVASGAAAGSNPNVKVVNGTTYYWVKGNTGSNLGARWMTKEEAKAAGLNVGTYSTEAIENIQARGFNPQGN
jgi:hypothetical protein